MRLRFGIIAEDQSDLEVLQILAARIITKKFSVSHFVGRGCGMVRRKARPWWENLVSKGCTHIAVVHDRDRSNAQELKAMLESLLPQSSQVKTAVIIPTEEIEAWLLSDAAAITSVLNLKNPLPSINHPERVASPKEHLASLVRRCSGKSKTYVTTVHNRMIAKEISIDAANKKCPSFSDFHAFVSAAAK